MSGWGEREERERERERKREREIHCFYFGSINFLLPQIHPKSKEGMDGAGKNRSWACLQENRVIPASRA